MTILESVIGCGVACMRYVSALQQAFRAAPEMSSVTGETAMTRYRVGGPEHGSDSEPRDIARMRWVNDDNVFCCLAIAIAFFGNGHDASPKHIRTLEAFCKRASWTLPGGVGIHRLLPRRPVAHALGGSNETGV